VHILDAIVRDDFAAATTDFDEPMRQTLTPSWAGYLEQFGTYQRHEVPQQARSAISPLSGCLSNSSTVAAGGFPLQRERGMCGRIESKPSVWVLCESSPRRPPGPVPDRPPRRCGR
jgi:hypothetical protein